MKLDYIKELNKMRKKYLKYPMKKFDAIKPNWLMDKDNVLNDIYDNTLAILENSNINYGCILQANTLLFDKKNKQDCPATFITSNSEYINNNPEILCSLADDIYQYKESEIEFVPQNLKKIVECIQDEYDFRRYKNEIEFENGNIVTIYIVTLMVIRKHIHKGYLRKRIYPLITNFEKTESATILPYKYWTRKVKKDN